MDATGHRALADPSRARILETLAEAGGPLDAHELAARVGLHPNTVRWHLGVLADAGFVSSSTEPRTRPGRPARRLHRDRGGGRGARGLPPARRHPRRLALGHGDRRRRGRAGRRGLGPLPRRAAAPFARLSAGDAADQVVRLLDEHGFEPERENGDVIMRRCPFRDLAEQHGDIVCSVHLGLIRGALAEIGAPVTATRLEPFVEPGLCRARLG